jgi:hypothetical protein
MELDTHARLKKETLFARWRHQLFRDFARHGGSLRQAGYSIKRHRIEHIAMPEIPVAAT